MMGFAPAANYEPVKTKDWLMIAGGIVLLVVLVIIFGMFVQSICGLDCQAQLNSQVEVAGYMPYEGDTDYITLEIYDIESDTKKTKTVAYIPLSKIDSIGTKPDHHAHTWFSSLDHHSSYDTTSLNKRPLI